MPSVRWRTELTRRMPFRSRSRSTCLRRKSRGSPAPKGTDWLADELRLSKGGILYFWRSYLDPIWNHHIRGPVRIWSVDDGPDERALTALEARDLGSLQQLIPEPADGRMQLREDLGAALAHLREVRDKYSLPTVSAARRRARSSYHEVIQDRFQVEFRLVPAGQGLKVCVREGPGDSVQVDNVPDHEAVMPGACLQAHGVIERQSADAYLRVNPDRDIAGSQRLLEQVYFQLTGGTGEPQHQACVTAGRLDKPHTVARGPESLQTCPAISGNGVPSLVAKSRS
jgi:hypothetical protein